MSYTNGTTHYNLPQTTGSDKRDWSDTNQAFADVDAALYGAVQDTAQAELDIDALETRMDTAELNIATNTGDIAGLDTRVTTVEGAVTSLSGQVTDTRQDLEDMICAYNEASATSTHAYGTGENDNHYFIYNDVLYRATQTIAIGDTIVPDTNCTTTNVTTEIASIDDLSGDVTQLQSDVGQLQSDIDGIEDKMWTVIKDHTYTSGTMAQAFADLFDGFILETNKDYKIHMITDEIIRTLTLSDANYSRQAFTFDNFINLYSGSSDSVLQSYSMLHPNSTTWLWVFDTLTIPNGSGTVTGANTNVSSSSAEGVRLVLMSINLPFN